MQHIWAGLHFGILSCDVSPSSYALIGVGQMAKKRTAKIWASELGRQESGGRNWAVEIEW